MNLENDDEKKKMLQEYLINKYRESSDDSGLKAAQEQQSSAKNISLIGEALSGFATAHGRARGYESDNSFWNKLGSRYDGNVEAARKAIADKQANFLNEDKLGQTAKERFRSDAEYDRTKKILDAQDDPNSFESQVARQLAGKMFPSGKLDQMTASQFKNVSPEIRSLYDAEMRAQAIKDQADERRIARQDSKETRDFMREQMRNDQQQKRLEDKVTKYTEALDKSGIPGIDSAISEVDKIMPAEGEDIPGYGMFDGALPGFMAGKEGRDLRQKIATLFNLELKDRSGAAVTDSELNRLREEFGSGSWTTEEQLRKGIDQYKTRLSQVARNIQAGYTDDVKNEYKNRGGSDFPAITGAQTPQTTQTDPKRAAAEKWLRENPNDPRAEAIRKKLGGM